MILSAWRPRVWVLVAGLFGLAAIVLVAIPVWTYGDDAGWYSCGTLWNKAADVAIDCEQGGSYRHRLWFVFAAALLAMVSVAVAARRRPRDATRGIALLGAVAAVSVLLGAGLWLDNDGVDVRPVYDFGDTTMEVEPVARALPAADETVPTYRLRVRADGWPSASAAVFVACRAGAVPESCELADASGDVVLPDDGAIDAEIDLRIPEDTRFVAGFDVEQITGHTEPWPPGTSVTAPLEPGAIPDELPTVEPTVARTEKPGSPTTSAADPSVADTSVVPSGFDSTAARVTMPTGERCEICVWLAETPGERARGLMGVTDLGAADAMAFVYPAAHTGSFWMKDTVLPLSIAFYGPHGEWLDAFDMEPCVTPRCPSYPTPDDFLVAVEVVRGELDDLGLVAGSTLDLLDLPCPDP